MSRLTRESALPAVPLNNGCNTGEPKAALAVAREDVDQVAANKGGSWLLELGHRIEGAVEGQAKAL
jgi:hypothetical protein